MVGGTHRDSWAAGVGCVECANPRNGLVYVWGDACPMAFLTNPFTPACPYSLEDAQHSTFGSIRLPKPHQANSSGAREHRRAARTQVSRAVSFAQAASRASNSSAASCCFGAPSPAMGTRLGTTHGLRLCLPSLAKSSRHRQTCFRSPGMAQTDKRCTVYCKPRPAPTKP